jgi:predicted DNA-binding WGR domain protein
MTTYYSLEVANDLHRTGKPWAVRVEYRGYNDDNKSGRSSKFWEIFSSGNGRVFCNWGALGTAGRSSPMEIEGFMEAYDKCCEKRAKGYRYMTGTQIQLPKAPTSVSELPEPYRSIRRLVDLGNGFFRAEDSGNQLIMELDREGKSQLMQFNPFVALVTL